MNENKPRKRICETRPRKGKGGQERPVLGKWEKHYRLGLIQDKKDRGKRGKTQKEALADRHPLTLEIIGKHKD